jgi:hypothetical protein
VTNNSDEWILHFTFVEFGKGSFASGSFEIETPLWRWFLSECQSSLSNIWSQSFTSFSLNCMVSGRMKYFNTPINNSIDSVLEHLIFNSLVSS